MGLAIHNLIESVCNPSGRFKMLDGIRVKTDSKGDPVFLYKDRSVCFWVDWNGNGYVLKCFLHCQESDKASLQQIAEYLEGINSPFLVDYVYLNDEMLVFDDSGNSYYIDVVLMGYSSEMVPMDEFLDRAAKRGDRQAVDRLLDDFCRMAVWLINDRIVHGAIRASNVLVASDGTVRLINYESMRIPPSGSMHGSVIDNDNIVVANLALALRVLRDDPSLFYTLRGNSMFRLPILRSSLLPMFAHAAQKSGCVPMQALVEMLSTCNHTLHSRRELSEVLEALTADRTPVTVDLSKIAIDSEEETYMHEMACENERKLRDNSFKAQYSWVGGMSEALISAEPERQVGIHRRRRPGRAAVSVQMGQRLRRRPGGRRRPVRDVCADRQDGPGNFARHVRIDGMGRGARSGQSLLRRRIRPGRSQRNGDRTVANTTGWAIPTIR